MSARPTDRGRGWSRSLTIAIAIHVVLAVIVWRLAVRLWAAPVNLAGGSTVGGVVETGKSEGQFSSRLPPILRVERAIDSAPLRSPVAAYQGTDVVVEWSAERHGMFGD